MAYWVCLTPAEAKSSFVIAADKILADFGLRLWRSSDFITAKGVRVVQLVALWPNGRHFRKCLCALYQTRIKGVQVSDNCKNDVDLITVDLIGPVELIQGSWYVLHGVLVLVLPLIAP